MHAKSKQLINLINLFSLFYLYSILFILQKRGNEEIASNLIRAGSDLNLRDLTGNTALHYGAMNGL